MQHGQYATHIADWDTRKEFPETVQIDEIDPVDGWVAFRPLGSDFIFRAHPDTFSNVHGIPCQCRA